MKRTSALTLFGLGVLASQTLVGCFNSESTNRPTTQEEADAFTGKNAPEWAKKWRPGMPIPGQPGAKTGASAQGAPPATAPKQ